MTFIYAARQIHPWWKFWHRFKWEVYRVNNPTYVLRGFTKRGATHYANIINILGR